MKFQPEPPKFEHLGMANSTMWPKERPPLLLMCPKSLGRCWGRSEKLPCPPVYLLHITCLQTSTKLHTQKLQEPPTLEHLGMANRIIITKERPPFLLKCRKVLVGAGAGLRSCLAHQSTSFTSLLAKPARSCTLKCQPEDWFSSFIMCGQRN